MANRIFSILGFGLAALVAKDAAACTCLGEWPSLRKLIRGATLAATAEIVAQGRPLQNRSFPELDVAYLDVRIIKRLRGKEERQIIRLWDPAFGTSCSLDLRSFTPGTYIAFAATRPSTEHEEYYKLLGFIPAAEEYLLGSCGDYYEALGSLEAARQFPKGSRLR